MAKRRSIKLPNVDEFVIHVTDMYDDDCQDRDTWSKKRIQRYAKIYGWQEPKNYPWPNASNQRVSLLLANALRTEDTLVNAVLASRPVMGAVATNKVDAEKGKVVDALLDYQLFIEQDGESKICNIANSYVFDGRAVVFVPWIREKRRTRELRPVPPLPQGIDSDEYYTRFLTDLYQNGMVKKNGPYSFTVVLIEPNEDEQEAIDVEFYDEDDTTYACIKRDTVVFDGPCPLPKTLEDIICPSRCENLQPPSPTNPLGADHVMMIDYPQWDEINRHIQSGYYDLLTDEDIKTLEEHTQAETGNEMTDNGRTVEEHKAQKDAFVGMDYGNAESTSKVFMRLTFFGRYQVKDGDFEEEVVARIIMTPDRNVKALARLRYLEEEFPKQDLSRPRPFISTPGFLPIPGQWFAMGLPEILEALHDSQKILLDQAIDKHTLCNTPFFFYRAASGVRPEVLTMNPGSGYPVSDPANDVVFPQIPMQDQMIGLNFYSLLQTMSDQLSMQGALQMGGVPQGKSSALRTSTNMQAVLQQGDARPERILRRFFLGIADLYQHMHELNRVFLKPGKQYRIAGPSQPGADPYRQINTPADIGGTFQFDFRANTLNTSKAAQAQILQGLMPALINGMTLQSGLVNPEKIYNLLSDLIKAQGQDENRYLNAPLNANIPKITAEEAIGQMISGQMPQGAPAEGAQNHLQMLQMYAKDPRFIMVLSTEKAFAVMYQAYVQQVQAQLAQEQAQAQQAQQFAATMQGSSGGRQPGPEGQVDPNANKMAVQGPNQVMDESLPGAKGMI